MAKYAQPILFFFCRPCGDYHPKTHPHYSEMLDRKVERAKSAPPKRLRQSRGASTADPGWRRGTGLSLAEG
jgi:hypothetical protein